MGAARRAAARPGESYRPDDSVSCAPRAALRAREGGAAAASMDPSLRRPPAPCPRPCSPAATFQSPLGPLHPGRGRVPRRGSVARTPPPGAPALPGVGVATARAAGSGLPGAGGAASHAQPPLLPPHPKSASDVSRPEQGGAGGGGAAWAAGCARTRACPGAPAQPVFGERAGPCPPPRTTPTYQRAAETW